jgi:hypothetical protein
MLPKPIFFYILLVCLLINVLSVSITFRDAHAVKIGFLETIDSWLDLPLGEQTEYKHITGDFKVTDWSSIDLDEIIVTEVPPRHNIIVSETDSSDPPRAVNKNPPSGLMIFPAVLVLLLFATCSGLAFRDKFTFKTVLHNCLRSDKRMSRHRIKKEIKRWCQFVSKILFIIVCYTVLGLTCYIAFSDILTTLFHQNSIWDNPFSLMGLLLFFVGTYYFCVFKLSLGIFKGYKEGVIRRSDFYRSVDLHRSNKKEAG